MPSPPPRPGPRRRHHRVGDLLVAGAPAQVAGQRLAHLRLGALGALVEKRLGGEDHARDAVAALHRAVLDERLLDRIEAPIAGEPLDGDDPTALALCGEHDAAVHRAPVEQHGAYPALGLEAVLLGAGQPQIDTEHVQESAVRLGEHVVTLAVDGQAQPQPAHEAPRRIRSRHRARARGTRVSTSTCRYRAEARTSVMGRQAAAAARPASRKTSGVGGCPSSRRSASRARHAVGATAPRATRALTQRSPPASSPSRAATHTTEISMARRRPALRNAVAVRASGIPKATPMSSSPGRQAVWPGPSKKSSSATARSPPTPRQATRASRARSTGTTSAAGEALARLPPTVPTLRIW